MSWERVYTISDYYDGPRSGVADFHGKPHIYRCQFDSSEDAYTDRFWLMEIDQELFALIMEDWRIWLRWSAAFKANETTLDTHPALPGERARHVELQHAIGGRANAQPDSSAIQRARFRGGADWNDIEVEWFDPDL